MKARFFALAKLQSAVLTALLACSALGTLLTGCRAEEEPKGAEAQVFGQSPAARLQQATRFAQLVQQQAPTIIDRAQRLAYTGNAFASDAAYVAAIEDARRILFEPVTPGGITLPSWQGIYLYGSIRLPVTARQVGQVVNTLARFPQITLLAAVGAGRAIPIETVKRNLAAAFENLSWASKAAILAAANSGQMEITFFGGVDRGESASSQGALYWGIILSAEAGPAGIGHEFIFDTHGHVYHANLVSTGLHNRFGQGGGGYFAWSEHGNELGLFLQPNQAPIGMFAAMNPDFLPPRARRIVTGEEPMPALPTGGRPSPAVASSSGSSEDLAQQAARKAAELRCDYNTTFGGSWSGCVHFVRWRAQATGRRVNSNLTASHLHTAMQGCINSTQGDQKDTCTRIWLTCLSSQWAADNYACLASNGGHSCRNQCR